MLEIISVILGLIGTILTLYFFWEKIFPLRKLSWKFAQKAAKKIANEMIVDNFSPTLIVGIGRGGSIMGALISGSLGHRPLIVIDRKYTWKKGDRCNEIIFFMDIPKNFLKHVLIVSGEVHSGNTMKVYLDYLKKLGAKSIRKATLFYEKDSTVGIDYMGVESKRKNVLMPWMFTKQYVRADRCPREANLMLGGTKVKSRK